MILNNEELKGICSKLLAALDSNSTSVITETLLIEAKDKILTLSITNMEYVMKIKLDIKSDEEFNAAVNADLFLKLINHLTTDTVELSIDDTILVVKSNGVYKLPMIFEEDKLVTLPNIVIDNVISEFSIDTKNLMMLYNYNSKELNKNLIGSPVQKMYYVDKDGCITFTSGACITNFSLPDEVKILLPQNIVKLFKLFSGDKLTMTLGKDALTDNLYQTKLQLKDSNIELSVILSSDENMINMVPKDSIRNMATKKYPYTVVVNKTSLLNIIDRLMLFMPSNLYLQPYGQFEFYEDHVTIFDKSKHNKEELMYVSPIELNNTPLNLILDLTDFKVMLSNVEEDTIKLHFGTGQAVVVERPNIYNVIPECVL